MSLHKKLNKEQIDKVEYLYLKDGLSQQKIASLLGYSRKLVKKCLSINDTKLRSQTDACNRYKNRCNIFSSLDNEYGPYYLGLFYADGCVKNKDNRCDIKLMESDRYILSKLSNLIFNADRTTFINNKKYVEKSNKNPNSKKIFNVDKINNSYALQIRDEDIRNSLITLGCTPNKSLTLNFPQITEDDQLRHFIRGYIDGDGCINFNGKSARVLIVSTKYFCHSLQEILKNKFDINCSIENNPSNHKSNNITKRLFINGNRQVEKFLDWLYKDAEYFLDRKYKKYLELKNRIAEVDSKTSKYTKQLPLI